MFPIQRSKFTNAATMRSVVARRFTLNGITSSRQNALLCWIKPPLRTRSERRWTRILPRLSVLAAMALVLLQVCAIAFHINRSEFNVLPLNLVLLLVPIFIVWGRSRLPIVPR